MILVIGLYAFGFLVTLIGAVVVSHELLKSPQWADSYRRGAQLGVTAMVVAVFWPLPCLIALIVLLSTRAAARRLTRRR